MTILRDNHLYHRPEVDAKEGIGVVNVCILYPKMVQCGHLKSQEVDKEFIKEMLHIIYQ